VPVAAETAWQAFTHGHLKRGQTIPHPWRRRRGGRLRGAIGIA